MLRKQKSAGSAEPFVVPALVDIDADYAAFVAKRAEILDAQTAAIREYRDLERELAEAPHPQMRPGAAALLGDPAAAEGLKKKARIGELRTLLTDIEAALDELRKREEPVRVRASASARARVSAEYGLRVSSLVEALIAADLAQREVSNLIEQMEREEILWSPLGDFRAGFLGSAVDPGRRIARFVADATAAGYWEAGR